MDKKLFNELPKKRLPSLPQSVPKKAAIVSQMPATILKREDPFQALIKQQAYFQEIQAKQQMEFQKQMMEFLKSKRIHE